MEKVLHRFIGPPFKAIQPWFLLLLVATWVGGCALDRPRVGAELVRQGDEIVVAGRFFHTGVPVMLWMDVGGYDAYRVERRFVPEADASWEVSSRAGLGSPNRYGVRRVALTGEDAERARAGQWTLETLRKCVDQFVIHYDASGTSRNCFRVLHDMRCLSVHFMIDLDGTIYQTLDVKERAWHAAEANDRSVGVEVANIGAYPVGEAEKVLGKWYTREEGGVRVTLPAGMGDGGLRTQGFVARPARPEAILGTIHGQEYVQYDFTPEQYNALAHLAAALHAALPGIKLDAPRGADERVLTRALTEDELQRYFGLLGHCHVTTNKVDPGPAMDWNNLLLAARRISAGKQSQR